MESFHEVHMGLDATKHSTALVKGPVSQITIKQGETKILALKKPGSTDSFAPEDILVSNPWIAWSWAVRKLRFPKHTYEQNDWTFQKIMAEGTSAPVEMKPFIFFQIVGLSEGMTQLTSGPFSSYIKPLSVLVVKNDKKEILTPNVPFSTLWQNHPFNPHKYTDSCDIPVGGHEENCMVRFSIALKQSDVDLSGLKGKKTCQWLVPQKQRDASHDHHFVNPYHFEEWRGTRNAYVFEAHSAVQPEPMPGLAAFAFVKDKTGIVLFKRYWATDSKHPNFPDGGHIDLWTGSEMGNGHGGYESRADSYFLRAQKIVFWPLD